MIITTGIIITAIGFLVLIISGKIVNLFDFDFPNDTKQIIRLLSLMIIIFGVMTICFDLLLTIILNNIDGYCISLSIDKTNDNAI